MNNPQRQYIIIKYTVYIKNKIIFQNIYLIELTKKVWYLLTYLEEYKL